VTCCAGRVSGLPVQAVVLHCGGGVLWEKVAFLVLWMTGTPALLGADSPLGTSVGCKSHSGLSFVPGGQVLCPGGPVFSHYSFASRCVDPKKGQSSHRNWASQNNLVSLRVWVEFARLSPGYVGR